MFPYMQQMCRISYKNTFTHVLLLLLYTFYVGVIKIGISFKQKFLEISGDERHLLAARGKIWLHIWHIMLI